MNTTFTPRTVFRFLLAIAAVACSPEESPAPVSGSLRMDFEHRSGNDSLVFNNVFYTNAAGNEYRVTLLKYFISGTELYNNGKLVYRQGIPPVTIDPAYGRNSVTLTGLPDVTFDSLAFSVGVVPEFNYTGAFQLSSDDLGMYWPVDMGGGYHFMRFEGHWRANDTTYGGFAFHLGESENLITVGFDLGTSRPTKNNPRLTLSMDVNRWFEGAWLYDFLIYGGYTMGDSVKMNMLKENGEGVFTLKP